MARTTYPGDMLRPAAPVTYPHREPLLRQDLLMRRLHDNENTRRGRRASDLVRDLDYKDTEMTAEIDAQGRSAQLELKFDASEKRL